MTNLESQHSCLPVLGDPLNVPSVGPVFPTGEMQSVLETVVGPGCLWKCSLVQDRCLIKSC